MSRRTAVDATTSWSSSGPARRAVLTTKAQLGRAVNGRAGSIQGRRTDWYSEASTRWAGSAPAAQLLGWVGFD